jgi:parallel beta-helix repeat protein
MRKTIFLVVMFCLLIGGAQATVSEIGCPYTYHKNGVNLYSASTPYTQLAMRWNYSQEITANRIGVGDYVGYGSGPIGVRVVNDDNGKPGTTIYASNSSATFLNKHAYTPMYIPLNNSFTLPANTPCWVIMDGRNISSENAITVATWDKDDLTVLADGCVGFDYPRWLTAGWNGAAWVTPSISGSNYAMYGCIALMDNDTFLGDGQWAIEESTHFVGNENFDGELLTTCPSQAFKINDVNIRMLASGDYGNVYFVVLDSEYNEIANRSLNPLTTGTWLKQRYVFTPAINIGAGNETIVCMIKAPQSVSFANGVQVRGVQYFTDAVSWSGGHRFSTGVGGVSNIWDDPVNDVETLSTDTMMNMTITYGDINHYYVSPSGNDSYEGTTPNTPWKTLAHAASTLPSNSTLYIMPGTYSGDSFALYYVNNVTIKPYSTSPIITRSSDGYGIQTGTNNYISCNNITVENITFTDNAYTSVYFAGGNNQTVKNCVMRNGSDGIRFKAGNDNLAYNNTISNMSQHGIHIFNQEFAAGLYSRNNIIQKNVSDCGHNMIDLHSNTSSCRIANNDVYFTDAWTGNKANVGVYLHNGNTPYTLVENNTIHHVGRQLEFNNAKDCMIRNNNFSDGLVWGSGSSSRIMFSAENGTVPVSPWGCNNITFAGNTFDGIGYPSMFYASGVTNPIHSNITYYNNTYTNILNANCRMFSSCTVNNTVFKNESFANFTFEWGGYTISKGDIKIKHSSRTPQDNRGDAFYQVDGVATLDIDPTVTDVWYGASYIPYPVADFTANVTSGVLPLSVQFYDNSTHEPTSWAWDFDSNGIIDSTDQNPTYQYRTKGNYTVHLTVRNDLGEDSEAKSRYITVQNQPWIIWVYYYIRSHIFHINVGGWLFD